MLTLINVLPRKATNGHGPPSDVPGDASGPVDTDFSARRSVLVYSVDVFFNARHAVKIDEKSGPVHPHSFRVSVLFKQVAHGDELETLSSGRMRDLIQNETTPWNGSLLNELPPFNGGREMSPTIERIAMVLFRRLQRKLPPVIKLESVSIWDSPTNNVTYAEIDE
jgi:6-pyruvoyl-tetrahydropterin synthase